jgi:excisionase family DNA binding protein
MTQPAEQPLTLEQAASRLGIHYMTVYRYVRLGRLNARQENGRWWVEAEAVDALVAPPRPAEQKAVRWNILRQRLLDRMAEGDLGGAWGVLEGAFQAGQPPIDLYIELLGPVLRQVGDEWASGARSVHSEHRVSSAALRLAGRIGSRGHRAGRRRRATVVLGGAPGDPHQLPLLMVADALRWDGFEVVDLGADVPAESFVAAATATPDLSAVGISLSVDHHRPAVAGILTGLRQVVPGAMLLAGGPALPDEASARVLGADGWAPHAGSVAQVISTHR